MFRRPRLISWLVLSFLLISWQAPAPLIYTPGEGWSWESAGGEGKWRRERAKDQLEVAQASFQAQDYGVAMKAARRVVSVWPLSDHAPMAQYIVGRCHEAKGDDEKKTEEKKSAATEPKEKKE